MTGWPPWTTPSNRESVSLAGSRNSATTVPSHSLDKLGQYRLRVGSNVSIVFGHINMRAGEIAVGIERARHCIDDVVLHDRIVRVSRRIVVGDNAPDLQRWAAPALQDDP